MENEAIYKKLFSAVYDSYKSVHYEESVQAAMKVEGATPAIMRECADYLVKQAEKNEGVEWGDVRARNMDLSWAKALREAASRIEARS
jgi:hypothetical protein